MAESCGVLVATFCDVDVTESFAAGMSMSCDRTTAEFGSVGSGSVELKSEARCGGERTAPLFAGDESLMIGNDMPVSALD